MKIISSDSNERRRLMTSDAKKLNFEILDRKFDKFDRKYNTFVFFFCFVFF